MQHPSTLSLSALLLAGLLVSGQAQGEDTLPPPSGEVVLTIGGAINVTNADGEAQLDAEMLASLPRHQMTTHTSVTDGPQAFEGFLARDLFEAVGAEGSEVTALALNDYRVTIPMTDVETYDVLMADTMNGERLTRRDKGPLWIVYPRDDHRALQDIRYDYRWVWQLYRLEIE